MLREKATAVIKLRVKETVLIKVFFGWGGGSNYSTDKFYEKCNCTANIVKKGKGNCIAKVKGIGNCIVKV